MFNGKRQGGQGEGGGGFNYEAGQDYTGYPLGLHHYRVIIIQ